MLTIYLAITFLCVCIYWLLATKRPKFYPPGPRWLPIIGNTFHLRNATKRYGSQIDAFRAWEKQYKSPLIGLKLGNELVVAALNYPLIHEIHTNEAFDGRPDNFFLRLRTMGSRLGITCTDGNLWSEQRNFVLRHLRRAGYGREAMEHQIQYELNELLEILDEQNEKPIWPGNFLPSSVLNVLWTFTAGTKISRSDERLKYLLDLMRQRSRAFDMSGGWLNTMPFLRFIAPEKTSYILIKRFNMELCNFFKPIIDEHKKNFTEDKIDDDLIYAFINEMRLANGKQTTFTDIQLTMVILDLFIAGAHTTSNTLDLILMSLIKYSHIQQRCHDEIDNVLGNTDLPSLKDKSKLAYIEAVILETQRIFNIVPMSGPRRVLKPTKLGDYYLPENTTILIGIETVNMDKEYWGDPDVFRPERFLDKNNKLCNTERLVSYGQGRRRCLGEALARASLFTFTVGILQKYRLELPKNGEIPSNILNIGIIKSTKPYNIVFRKR